MADKQATVQQGRTAKFYDDILNCRLRELMDGREAKTEELATALGISSNAVRSWYTGYARPDMDKLPIICRFYGVSADWLLGLSDTQSVDIELRDICEKTGLSEKALLVMVRNSRKCNRNSVPNSHNSATAEERLWLINHLIEDEETINMLADNANLYVNIKNAVENFEIPEYEGADVIEIIKLGNKNFGMTLNYTQGKETKDFYSYLCQKRFMEFVEELQIPAYWLKGWETGERKKEIPEPSDSKKY